MARDFADRFRLRVLRHGTEDRGEICIAVWAECPVHGSGRIILALDSTIVSLTPDKCAALEAALAENRMRSR